MKNFIIYNPVKIHFGNGVFAEAGKEAAALGKKALIVTGKNSAKKTGVLDRLVSILKKKGVEPAVYDGVTPNPKTTEVDEAAALGVKSGSDFVIGLGGGSAMDAAKGAAVAAASGGKLWDYIALPDKKAAQVKNALPIMLIPTLAATGSEGNPAAVFTNPETSQKAALYNPGKIYPVLSIVDPELTLTVPKKQTAEGIIDVIMHVLEEYLTGEGDCALQDRITEGIILTCIESGQRVMENLSDREARADISLASTVALQGLPNSGRAGAWVVHPLEHAVSGLYDSIAHGAGIAALLPPYLKFLGEVQPGKVRQLANRLFGAPEEADGDELTGICIEGMRSLLGGLGLPLSLKEQGIEEGAAGKLAEKVMAVSGMPHPKLNKERLKKIFEEAWDGE